MSYTRFDDQNDGGQLTRLREALSQEIQAYTGEQFVIFQDIENIEWGQRFEERIEEALHIATFLIPIITPSFFKSKYCREELQLFLQYEAERGRNDLILPIYYIECDELENLPSHVSDELVQTLATRQRSDWRALRFESFRTKKVRATLSKTAKQIRDALKRPPEVSVTSRYVVQEKHTPIHNIPTLASLHSGIIPLDSAFYVERLSDSIALDAIKRQGITLTIKAPGQMGKSSLLIRVEDAAIKINKRVTRITFNTLDLTDPNIFFRQLCFLLTDDLALNDQLDKYWNIPTSYTDRCTRYLEQYILKEIKSSLLISMDGVDRLFDTPFCLDFFNMLKGWGEKRARYPMVWNNLDVVLSASTEPYHSINDLTPSFFSDIGEVIELTDLQLEQVRDLNLRHGSPLVAEEERQLMELLSGHPFLVRQALYLISSGRITSAELFNNAVSSNSPFISHLHRLLFCLRKREDLTEGMAQVLREYKCEDIRVLIRLLGLGLVRRKDQMILPRCQLYTDFMRQHLFC